MDLSFPRFDRAATLAVWPGDLAVLMIGAAARQGASPTACVQATLGPPAIVDPGAAQAHPGLFPPGDGAFHGGLARSLAEWKAHQT